MSPSNLLPAEGRALDAISTFTADRGYPPTVREVRDLMGWKSHGSTYTTLSRMRDKGLVSWEPGTSRTLRVVQ